MIKKINHIGIAVNNIEEALKLYAGVLGLRPESIEVVAEQKVRTAIIPVGDCKLELLESTDPSGAIARHIEKFGEGLHHVALEVENVEQTLRTVKDKGLMLIDEKPRKGVENTKIAFLHPKSTGRVLLELVEK